MFLEDVRDSFRTISCGIPIPHEIVRKESISTRLVWCHGTCPPLSSPPHANSFVIGPAVIKHKHTVKPSSLATTFFVSRLPPRRSQGAGSRSIGPRGCAKAPCCSSTSAIRLRSTCSNPLKMLSYTVLCSYPPRIWLTGLCQIAA